MKVKGKKRKTRTLIIHAHMQSRCQKAWFYIIRIKFTQCINVFFELFRVITLFRHYLVNYIVYGQFYISAYTGCGHTLCQLTDATSG